MIVAAAARTLQTAEREVLVRKSEEPEPLGVTMLRTSLRPGILRRSALFPGQFSSKPFVLLGAFRPRAIFSDTSVLSPARQRHATLEASTGLKPQFVS